MNISKQKLAKLLVMSILTSLFAACFEAKTEKFAEAAPVKKIVFDAPFPGDLIYQSAPDPQIIIGKKKVEPAMYEIAAFESATGKRLWQLPFAGEVVGQTEKQILVYEEKTSTVHFINPKDGEITRRISPAPNPLTSKNSLETGMAFTDDLYITTKALYTSIWKNEKEDESYKIGYTAKNWASDDVKWFVPPIRQIVILGYRPVIYGDKVLIINAEQGIYDAPSYQIISLKTGEEISRVASNGNFSLIGKGFFIERTKSFVRRIEPISGTEIWKVEGEFNNVSVAAIGGQITIAVPHADRTRTIRVVDAATGKLLKQFDLQDLTETDLKACYITKNDLILLNFDSATHDIYDKAHYNYWVAYNADAKKALWRTDFESHSASSLLPFASDKIQFKDGN